LKKEKRALVEKRKNVKERRVGKGQLWGEGKTQRRNVYSLEGWEGGKKGEKLAAKGKEKNLRTFLEKDNLTVPWEAFLLGGPMNWY